MGDNSMKMPKRDSSSHKGSYGKVLNIAGSNKYSGAAYLSSISALKVGCGYVTLATCPDLIPILSTMTPNLVFKNFNKLRNTLKSYDAISIGCGLSTSKKALTIVKSVLSEIETLETPIIVDADGLNILAELKDVYELKNLVITPHPLEAARLLNTTLEDVLNSKKEAVATLSRKYNCITVLKLHKTLICDKNFEITTNQTGNSALSKAGSGDVLCGMITGLVAQNIELIEAVKLAVALHGRTGEIASENLTEYSVLASDLLNYIPAAIREFT